MAFSDVKPYMRSHPLMAKRSVTITPSGTEISPPLDGIRVSADADVTLQFVNADDPVTLALKAGTDYSYSLKKVTTVSTGTATGLYLV